MEKGPAMGARKTLRRITRLVNYRTAIVVHDLTMVVVAWTLSYLVPYNFTVGLVGPAVVQPLPIVLLVQGLIFWQLGLYRGIWRFASVPDLWNIMRAVAAGVIAISIALFLTRRLEGVPRSLLLLYPLLLFFLLGAPRMVYRIWRDHRFKIGGGSGGPTRIIALLPKEEE